MNVLLNKKGVKILNGIRGSPILLLVHTVWDRAITVLDSNSRCLVGRDQGVDIFTVPVWTGSGYYNIIYARDRFGRERDFLSLAGSWDRSVSRYIPREQSRDPVRGVHLIFRRGSLPTEKSVESAQG